MRAALFVIGFLLAIPAPPAAAWQAHSDGALGFSVDFPGTPTASIGTYKTDFVKSAVAHNATFKTDSAIFVASVVDLQDLDRDGAKIMIEAEYFLNWLGEFAQNSTSRITANWDYGRFISIDCKEVMPETPNVDKKAHQWLVDAFGTDCPTGARMTTNMFFSKGRMYVMIGINLPSEKARSSFEAMRFVQSFAWYAPPNQGGTPGR